MSKRSPAPGGAVQEQGREARGGASNLGERLGWPRLRDRRGLVVAMVVDSLGSGLFLPFAVIYATVVAGIPLATTGALLSLAALAGLPVPPVAGSLVDRFGARRVVVAANLLQMLGFAGYPFITRPWQLLICALLISLGGQMFWAANPTLLAQIALPGERDRWFALQGTSRNAGVGVGTLLAGVAVTLDRGMGYQALAALNAASYLVAGALIARSPAARQLAGRPVQHAPGGLGDAGGGYGRIVRDVPFLGFTLANVAFSLATLAFSIALPVYVLGPLRQPAWVMGLIFTGNTVLVAGAQSPIVRLIERHRRTHMLLLAALLFALAFLALAGLAPLPAAWAMVGLFVALLVYTGAVLVMAPLKNALVADTAPDSLRGRYVAFYHLSFSFASTVAPAVLTGLLAMGGGWCWLALAGLLATNALLLRWLDAALPGRATQPRITRRAAMAPRESGG